MRSLLIYLKGYVKECILGPLFKLLEAGFDLIVPLVTAYIIDNGIAQENKKEVLFYGGILILLAIVGLTCSVIAQYFAAKAAVGFAAGLRHTLFAHISTLSFAEIDKTGNSTLITRMTSDINQLQSGVNMALRLFLRSPFIVFGAVVMAFFIDVKAALIFVVVIPLLAIVVFGIMKLTMPLYGKVQANLDRVLGSTRENLSGVRVIRAFCRENQEKTNYENQNDDLFCGQLLVGKISALTNPLTYVMINGALIVLLWVGGIRIHAGTLTTGKVIALINYLSQILVELIKLANTIVMTNKALASAKRIEDVLKLTSSLTDGKVTANRERGGKIEFTDVSLTYSDASEPSLSHVTFTANPGETIGIIGGTGSGKSTLVKLIPRFYDVTTGSIRINDIDVKDYTLESLRSKIGFVLQKSVLFQGTIAQNLLWGNDTASKQELYEALRIAQALDFVENKEDGINSHVEQGGRNFSGGQKQRLTIARALVRKPEILVFDDSTSALDYITDARLRNELKALNYHPTIFMVSQRTSSIRHADKIIVLEDGNVAGMGTHDSLLAHCDVYREIHESQYQSAEGKEAVRE